MLAAVSMLKRRCSNDSIIQLNLWLLEGSRQKAQEHTGMNLNCLWLSLKILRYLPCSTIGIKDHLGWGVKQNSLGKHDSQELSCAFPRHFNETFEYSLEFWENHYTKKVWANVFWLLKPYLCSQLSSRLKWWIWPSLQRMLWFSTGFPASCQRGKQYHLWRLMAGLKMSKVKYRRWQSLP